MADFTKELMKDFFHREVDEDFDEGFGRKVIDVLMKHTTERLDGGSNRCDEKMMEDLFVLIRDMFIAAKIVWRQVLVVAKNDIESKPETKNVIHQHSDTRANLMDAKNIWKPGLMVPKAMLSSSNL